MHEAWVTSCSACDEWGLGWDGLLLLSDGAASPGLRHLPRGRWLGAGSCCEVLHLSSSLSCVTGGNRACQDQAVSWLDHCWATGSAFSWKLLKHTMIIHMKLSGSASMVQCSINTVLMQQCCYLGCELSLWGQGAHGGHDTNAALNLPGAL